MKSFSLWIKKSKNLIKVGIINVYPEKYVFNIHYNLVIVVRSVKRGYLFVDKDEENNCKHFETNSLK